MCPRAAAWPEGGGARRRMRPHTDAGFGALSGERGAYLPAERPSAASSAARLAATQQQRCRASTAPAYTAPSPTPTLTRRGKSRKIRRAAGGLRGKGHPQFSLRSTLRNWKYQGNLQGARSTGNGLARFPSYGTMSSDNSDTERRSLDRTASSGSTARRAGCRPTRSCRTFGTRPSLTPSKRTATVLNLRSSNRLLLRS